MGDPIGQEGFCSCLEDIGENVIRYNGRPMSVHETNSRGGDKALIRYLISLLSHHKSNSGNWLAFSFI